MRRSVIVLLVVAAGMTSVSGQEAASPIDIRPATARPDLSLSFEVASVKPSASRTTSYTVSLRPGEFRAIHQTLNQLIAFAFDVRSFQVVGPPKWAESQHWEINARTPPWSRYLEEHQAMLRRLLETRFGLKHRVETRNLPVYELRRARQDGTFGPRLTRFAGECYVPANPVSVEATKLEKMCRFSISAGVVNAIGIDWEVLSLVRNLTELDRLVIDKTGLTGKFNASMRWTPDASGGRPDDVSLFTALREQLGLRLEPATGPVEVIVVEDARLPDPD